MLRINLLYKKCRICGEELPIRFFYSSRLNTCKDCHQAKARCYRFDNPWVKTYLNIARRCNGKSKDPRHIKYQGIKNLVNVAELKQLWERDKAWEMDRPSIDRIDPGGHYEFNNLRYMELSENISRATRKTG